MAVPAAHAYGSNALWQIGLSFNCNNPSFCDSMRGGFWGWVGFDSGGLGDATLTGCGHLTGPTSHGSGGADHFNVEITGWTIMPGSAGPLTFFVTSGTMTFTGTVPRGPPITVPISPTPLDTGFPAVPGHFSTSMILGFTPPTRHDLHNTSSAANALRVEGERRLTLKNPFFFLSSQVRNQIWLNRRCFVDFNG